MHVLTLPVTLVLGWGGGCCRRLQGFNHLLQLLLLALNEIKLCLQSCLVCLRGQMHKERLAQCNTLATYSFYSVTLILIYITLAIPDEFGGT